MYSRFPLLPADARRPVPPGQSLNICLAQPPATTLYRAVAPRSSPRPSSRITSCARRRSPRRRVDDLYTSTRTCADRSTASRNRFVRDLCGTLLAYGARSERISRSKRQKIDSVFRFKLSRQYPSYIVQ